MDHSIVTRLFSQEFFISLNCSGFAALLENVFFSPIQMAINFVHVELCGVKKTESIIITQINAKILNRIKSVFGV